MKKVLMIGNHSSVKGGITSVINQLLGYNWKGEGVVVKFIPTYIDVNIFCKIIFFIFSYIKILFNLIFFRPDIVHMHMSYKGSFDRVYMIHKLCKIFSVKDIVHLHGSEFKCWYDSCTFKKQEIIRSLLKECNMIIVLGSEWKYRIKQIESKAKVRIIHNTAPISANYTKFNNESFQILFLGVLIKRKGVSDLLEAINNLKIKNKLSNVKCIIAGSGEQEIVLKKKSSELKLNELVYFKGWTDNKLKKQLFIESQLLVLPSYNEGLPMSILEAMSYGLPIIATDVGDIKEAVLEEENGYIITPGCISELENAIEKMLCKSEQEWNEFSAKSREIFEKNFSDEEYMQKICQLYMEI